ncbi:MAG: hypothetical protein WBG13_02355, partial [Pseudolabrys sp.]
ASSNSNFRIVFGCYSSADTLGTESVAKPVQVLVQFQPLPSAVLSINLASTLRGNLLAMC